MRAHGSNAHLQRIRRLLGCPRPPLPSPQQRYPRTRLWPAVIGYAGASQGTVIEEAGIALVPFADKEALGAELCKILTNPELWREMHEKNLRVQRDYLSWDATGATYAEFFAGRPD